MNRTPVSSSRYNYYIEIQVIPQKTLNQRFNLKKKMTRSNKHKTITKPTNLFQYNRKTQKYKTIQSRKTT